jgi:stearoyl-CoA desaturase (delta-9 desaturase)
MGCTRQGFYWWEIDITYYVLKCLAWAGVIWDLKPVPTKAYSHDEQLPRRKFASAA